MELALEREAEVEELSRALAHARDFLYLGRGVNYPIALEGALEAQGDLLPPRRGLPGRAR